MKYLPILLFCFVMVFATGCTDQQGPTAFDQGEITSLEDLSVSSLDKHSSNPSIPIALARADNPRDFVPDLLGETVTVRGVITSPNFVNLATFHFIQDNSAGMGLFAPAAVSLPVLKMGDEVVVTGVIAQFRGTTEIVLQSASDLQIVGTGRLRKPKKIHAAHLADRVGERIEGQPVVLEKVRIVDGDEFPPEGSSALIRVVDSKGDTANVFIDRDTDIDGSATPDGLFNLTGLANQFTFGVPADGGYQILPRGLFDID